MAYIAAKAHNPWLEGIAVAMGVILWSVAAQAYPEGNCVILYVSGIFNRVGKVDC